MKLTLKIITCFFFSIAATQAKMGPPIVYEVTATSLKVRTDTNTKSKVLYVIPKGSYVYNAGADSVQAETVDGIQGEWIAQFDGYVFSGYLAPTERPIKPANRNCTLVKNALHCDDGSGNIGAYEFNASTPLVGSWVQYDEQTGCKVVSAPNIYEKSSKRLAAALAHGDLHWVYEPTAKGGKILQFIVRVAGRGGC